MTMPTVSSPWMELVRRTSGSASVDCTSSEMTMPHMARPWTEVPTVTVRARVGWAAARAARSVPIWAWVG